MNQFLLEESETEYKTVLQQNPSHIEAKYGLANVAVMLGKTSEAMIRVEKLCADSPEFAPAWLLRTRLDLQEGRALQAREHYQKALDLDPQLADAELEKRIPEPKPDPSNPSMHVNPMAGGFGMAEAEEPFYSGEEMEEPDELGLEIAERPDLNFSKVGGMESVKENIRMKILYPLENPDLFKAYGKKVGGGVLLYGPPGCGKTLISRATAGEMDVTYLSLGLHQILDMWIGGSEKKLHEIFEYARSKAPCVLFFDEVDALAADRKDMRTSASRTVINQFLAELDGEMGDNDGVLVLGATNAPWHLDSAFLRPGRFDRIVFVPPPDQEARERIIEIMAEGKPVEELRTGQLAAKMKEFSGADIKSVFDQAIEETLSSAMKRGKVEPVTMKTLFKTIKYTKPSCRKWFDSAKNYALYANQSGFYDEVLDYLGMKK